MIHDPFEYRTECKSVMPAESCRKPKDWNSVPIRLSMRFAFRRWYCWMKEGQNAAVSEARTRIISLRKKCPHIRWSHGVVSLVDHYGLETLWRELVQAFFLKQSLICRDGSFCRLDNRSLQNEAKTDRSAAPDALCLPPCSISTDQSGRCCFAWAAACFASSMLLTITNDFVASG